MGVQLYGFDETIAGLEAFDAGLPGAIYAARKELTDDAHEATRNEPPPRPSYARTHNYQGHQVVAYGEVAIEGQGFDETLEPYGLFLRGDGEGYDGRPGIWSDTWDSISSIVQRLDESAEEVFDRNIDGLQFRTFGE